MKFLAVSVFGVLFALNSYAKNLECEIKVNDSVMSTKAVTGVINEKSEIGEVDSMRAFVTERENDYFTIEVFLGNSEARLYSEGFLKTSTDKLVLSFWDREVLLEVQCASL